MPSTPPKPAPHVYTSAVVRELPKPPADPRDGKTW
jgi:hypothetical protein